jgi:hypothetical protein
MKQKLTALYQPKTVPNLCLINNSRFRYFFSEHVLSSLVVQNTRVMVNLAAAIIATHFTRSEISTHERRNPNRQRLGV